MTDREDILDHLVNNPRWFSVYDLVEVFPDQTDKGIGQKLRALQRFGCVDVDRRRPVKGVTRPWLWRAVVP